MTVQRRYPLGAESVAGAGVHFRIWAPDHHTATLLLEKPASAPTTYAMQREKNGYFSILVAAAKAGSLYRFSLGHAGQGLADPASRFQPHGPLGPSCVVAEDYPWTDDDWPGLTLEGQILYEMHIGTFTPEGTFLAAMAQLEELVAVGITTVEIMPLNDFPGHYGWGYDGVNLYAPTRLYGTPQDLKALINRAHALGLGVILDVVYNHLGPEGNQLLQFSHKYITKKYNTEWGDAIDFDEPGVREFFITNARYWIEEYHFDGLRVDATTCIFSSTPVNALTEIVQAARAGAGQRHIIIIAENEAQNSNMLHAYADGGMGYDGLWNDDFHHTACVRLTGKREAYYTDYLGSPQEFISALKYGFLYQGQYYSWQKQKRGTADLQLTPEKFVIFLENHDQVANSGQGKRLRQWSDPGNFKALTCLLLLSPNTPLLFQGQEFGSTRPFYYFADHGDDLSPLVHQGRRTFLAQFPRLANAESLTDVPNPADPMTFARCKLDFKERVENALLYALHKDLIHLRKQDPVFQKMQRLKYDGAVLGHDAFLIRYFGQELGDRLLIVNFGSDHLFIPAPEPLLVAGQGLDWEVAWSSESIMYGGEGTPSIHIPHWKILGHSALVLKTKKARSKKQTT